MVKRDKWEDAQITASQQTKALIMKPLQTRDDKIAICQNVQSHPKLFCPNYHVCHEVMKSLRYAEVVIRKQKAPL